MKGTFHDTSGGKGPLDHWSLGLSCLCGWVDLEPQVNVSKQAAHFCASEELLKMPEYMVAVNMTSQDIMDILIEITS